MDFFKQHRKNKIKPENFHSDLIGHLEIARPVTLERILAHLVFWCWDFYEVYKGFGWVLRVKDQPADPALHHYLFWSHAACTITAFYLVSYLVLPSLIKLLVYFQAVRRILWLRLLYVCGAAVLVAAFYNIYDYYVFGYAAQHFTPVPDYIQRNVDKMAPTGPLGVFKDGSVQTFIWAYNVSYLLLPCLLRIIRWMCLWGVDNLKKHQQNQLLIQEQSRYLQEQITPHFLFNVLNNIYALVQRTNQQAASLLRQLTEFLKYSLYKTQQPYVALVEELAFLKNFVDIQQSRLVHVHQIQFHQQGNPEPFQVPPLLLLTFIENAFKHALLRSWEDGWVLIEINIREDKMQLELTVKNSVAEVPPEENAQTGGLGLINIKKRLNVLFKPGEYTLDINQQAKTFEVRLLIPLQKMPSNQYTHAY